jgi:rubrerythrin
VNPEPSLDRRNLLRFGGVAALGTLLVAACGTDDTAGTSTVPPRLGDAPPLGTLPTPVIDDAVLLRTAASLEYTAIEAYDLVLGQLSGLFTGPNAELIPVVERLRSDHRGHAEKVNEALLTMQAQPFECANARLQAVYVLPALELILGTEAAVAYGVTPVGEPKAPSDTPLEDVLTLAQGLENLAAATYQSVVPSLSQPALRRVAMSIAADEARHATVIARRLQPQMILPNGDSAATDAQAAVPSTFGNIGQIPVYLGARNQVGNKTVVNLETPSLNALIYPTTTC